MIRFNYKIGIRGTVLFFAFSLNSCTYFFGPKVEITNHTDLVIDEVVVYTTDEFSALRFRNLKSGARVIDRLDMIESAHHPRDGAYGIRYTLKGKQQKQINSIGYFSNGHAIHDKIIIEIKNDTTLFTYE